MHVADFRITRFQYARDRVIGDSQVRIQDMYVATLELIADSGEVGLGFILSLFHPLPDQVEIERVFRTEAWEGIEGQPPAALVHRVCHALAAAISGPFRSHSTKLSNWRYGT